MNILCTFAITGFKVNAYIYQTIEQFPIVKILLRWILLIFTVAISTGLAVALFLWLLDVATTARWQNLWLIFLLPFAGIIITWIYRHYGKNSDAGNKLIIDEIHQPGAGVPARMAPLILFSTIITHLFGGSAGREGTGIQMGAGISVLPSRWLKLQHEEKRILLMCGVAAGFGAVFGTPVAAAIFALEIVSTGRKKYKAFVPCLITGVVADITCSYCGIHHTQYQVAFTNPDILLVLKVSLAGILFGLVGFIFIQLSHFIKAKSNQYIAVKWLIPLLGAALIITISYLLGTSDYLGLGVTNPGINSISIVNAFKASNIPYFSWFWKLLLTAITLSMGFKGGEVTPLFFMGATLGNTLAVITGSPIDLFAAIGFIAVFAGATKTPIASIILGIELFGPGNVIYYAVACFAAYFLSKKLIK